MKAIFSASLALMITGTQALASTGGSDTGGIGLLATFFIAFGVLVVLFQFIPGILLLVGILKGMFSGAKKPSDDAVEHGKTL